MVSPGVTDAAGEGGETRAGDRRQLGKALGGEGRNTGHSNSEQNRLSPAAAKSPLRPPGGRGRGPRSGRVRCMALLTGLTAPLTQPSRPGRRGERVKKALEP